jgi:excisionase family DNA binding protein
MTINPSPPSQSSDLSIKAAASLTPCCVCSLRKEIARGRLRAYRIGRRIFIKPEDLTAYLLERKIPVNPDQSAQKARLDDLKDGTRDEQNRPTMVACLAHLGAQMIEPTTVISTASATPRKEVPNDQQ